MLNRFLSLKLALTASSLMVLTACQAGTPQVIPSAPASSSQPTSAPTTSPAPASPVVPSPSPNLSENPVATPSAAVTPVPGGTTNATAAPTSPTPQPTASADPAALPANDIGFKPKPNGFGFANGSGDKYDPANPATEYLTVSGMQKMFGVENVCTGSTSGDTCVPTPPAKKWLEKTNTGMNGGQCEGMAVMALSLFKGIDKLTDLETGKENSFDLSYSGKVRNMVGYYFAYQYTENVSKATVKGTPNEVLEKLKTVLTANAADPVTLGFYGKEGGHATTAYGIADKGNGIFHVLMYDNNWPGQERYIEIDTKANTWLYNFAATNPSQTADAWQGNADTKTFEFTPLSARLSKATCPYCNEGASSSPSREIFLSAGNSGNAHLKVVDKSDPSKFIGWDSASGKYVNNLGKGELIYEKSVVKVGDSPVTPAIRVPAGFNYDIKVDGKDLKASEQVKVSVFGQGKSLEVSNIDLDPFQEDTVSLGADGDSVKYKPGNSPDVESPKISVGYDDPNGKDYAFDVKNLEATNGEELSADLNNGKLKVGDTGTTADPYDLIVNRFNDNGGEVDFSKDNISLGAGETDNIDFTNWAGQGQGMLVGPDGKETVEPDIDGDASN